MQNSPGWAKTDVAHSTALSVDGCIQHWVQIIRGEYLEIPGLLLTRSQIQRLWGHDAARCDQVLDALLAARFLCQTRDGGFVRA